jgi:hypothetical protein
MKYQPEILRGQPFNESPYVHFRGIFYPLDRSIRTNALMTFREGANEYVFDIPRLILRAFEQGEVAPFSLKWLVTVSPNRIKSVPRLPAIKDSDDFN